MSQGQLTDFTLYQLVKTLENKSKARCQDEYGACEVLQKAVNLKHDIYLFFSSDTGLIAIFPEIKL